MQIPDSRRVVITGVGVISPLGMDADEMLKQLQNGVSGVRPFQNLPHKVLGTSHGAEAWDFTGDIDCYGELDKKFARAIKKGRNMMCREIEMAVASAQRALAYAQIDLQAHDRERIGVIYGTDYIMSTPADLTPGVEVCIQENGEFEFSRWGSEGLSKVEPKWLLKYLPNMPASHIAIYNDLRGPNNSLTLREASSCASLTEAYYTITRGHADAMIVGATGTRIHELRSLHASMQEKLAGDQDDPTTMSRPFCKDRDGSVLGEGAGTIVCETLEMATARGATILGEVVGCATSCVGGQDQFRRKAFGNVMRSVLEDTDPSTVGHINAHGLADPQCDLEEALAIADVFGDSESPPVTTAKGHIGNLGAGGGLVEIIASVLSLGQNLFPVLNAAPVDPECPINVCTDNSVAAGDSFVSTNITPQGQASAVRIAKLA